MNLLDIFVAEPDAPGPTCKFEPLLHPEFTVMQTSSSTFSEIDDVSKPLSIITIDSSTAADAGTIVNNDATETAQIPIIFFIL